MKTYKYPKKVEWELLCKRNKLAENTITETVSVVLKDVKENKDKALFKYANLFDNVNLSTLKVTEKELEKAVGLVSDELKKAIELAKQNIEAFHNSQKEKKSVIETTKGVQCWRKSVAIGKVGLYIPSGTAPLFSTILMLGIPAKIAKCKEIILCSPPNKKGEIHPAILYTAKLIGITKIYKAGGSQAIGAMAYGTESIPKVYKIFGPGNQYVTKAKELVQQSGVAIDMPAGPSEVLVIADDSCNTSFVASDLLSQAEHGADSQVVLLSDNELIVNEVIKKIKEQITELPRKEIIEKSLKNSNAIVLNSIEECFEFSNMYAPEHLIVASKKADNFITKITNAGSVFLGNYSCESAGDYASGTNHTLPTYGYAKNYSGVSLDSFVKKITFQKLSKEGIKNIGDAIELMADAEGLQAHKNAVSIRLKTL